MQIRYPLPLSSQAFDTLIRANNKEKIRSNVRLVACPAVSAKNTVGRWTHITLDLSHERRGTLFTNRVFMCCNGCMFLTVA